MRKGGKRKKGIPARSGSPLGFRYCALLEGRDGLLDDADGLTQLLLGDDKWGSKADNVLVCGLSQHAHIVHLQAHIPILLAVAGLDNDGVQKTFTAHFLNYGALEVAHLIAEDFAQALGILHQMIVLDNLQGSIGYIGGNGVATERGAVLAGFDVQHDVVVGQYAVNRCNASFHQL